MKSEMMRLAKEAEGKRMASKAAWDAGNVKLSEEFDRQAEAREQQVWDMAKKLGVR